MKTESERRYQSQLKLIDYQLNKIQSKLKQYESIGCILLNSENEKRSDIGRLVMSLITEIDRQTSGIQSAVEDLKQLR
ncbi:hypothetical protein [Gynuella sunshinyii]|uniref:Uncharacterized protein n=1 Tax=Gynuella sunshinyii YC6258 TaxID=1445510 RepID=A0A0C5VIS6_9GAMM|nr:hypothetical protein [Gynuella sunshinyii]AJQ94166.1 hypothetical Protein YC6258_02128 [Gynuella sunshinyii YC6258]